ncbi:MAG: heavy metal translocating P-type ATPase [Pirellulales bacterium]
MQKDALAMDSVDTPLKTNSSHRTTDACAHCGLPIPESELGQSFCCNGCKSAYALIQSEGLQQYYELLDRLSGGESRPVDEKLFHESFVDLDAPGFWQENVVPIPGGRVQAILLLHGIHCAACIWLLERLPQIQPGVLDARVDLHRSTIEIIWNPNRVALSTIAQQLAKLGYRVAPLGSASQDRAKRKEQRRQLIQIAIAGACMGNVMLLALAIYAGEWTGMAAEHLQLLRMASAAVGLVSLLGPGGTFFRGAWAALRLRTAHMDLPIALGLGVGAISGAWNTLRGTGEIFFDSLSMLVFFLLIGRALQSRQQQAACEAVDLLRQLTPGTTKRIRNDQVEPVAVEQIEVGDVLEIDAEQTIPVDGRVVYGKSEVDTSLLTGESRPVLVQPGESVVAGTLNRSQTLRIQAEKVGRETRLGHIVESIHRASLEKAPIVQWADRISGYFVMIVITLAMLVGLTWYFIDPSVWTDRVIALLIVACPCALGLATPLAIAIGLGISARRGVLIKGGDSLQRLAQPGILVLDKTGTVTQGRMSVQSWEGSMDVLRWTASIEKSSTHPIAIAIREYWTTRTQGEALPQASEWTSHIGHGVSGRVDDTEIVAGSRAFMLSLGYELSTDMEAKHDRILQLGHTPLLVAIDRSVIAIASLHDAIRPEASAVLNRLRSKGWTVRMLSGDHDQIVQRVAKGLGMNSGEAQGGVSPEGKLQAIQQWKKQGVPVLMVGDGVNDAAALAAADVGIAVRGGAEVSLQAADVFLAHGSLTGIESILDSAQRTMRVIRRNSVASLGYNILAVTLASLGWLHPLAAAALMPLSSLTVVAVTLLGQVETPAQASRRTRQSIDRETILAGEGS